MSDLDTPKAAGFSLVEVMVSLVLVSLTGLAGLTLVDSLTNVQLRLDERYQRLETLHTFWRAFQADLEQATPDSLALSTDEIQLSTWACGRSATLAYSWVDQKLIRNGPACQDTPAPLDIAQAPKIFVLTASGERLTSWPPAGGEYSLTPRAIEIEIRLHPIGEADGAVISRLLELPGTAP